MKDYAAKFYKSRRWRECREAYAGHVGHLCERCLKKGLVVPGEIVHHKIHITPDNINNPLITLDWNNLELLCRECHAKEHDGINRRYRVDELGRITAQE